MRAPILRLYVVVVVLFALLVAFTSRWTVWEAEELRANPLNRRELLEQLFIERGRISADDGSALATSVPGPGGTWERRYPRGGLFAQSIGYAFPALGQSAGLERSRNDPLTGRGNEFASVLDQLRGREQQGDAIRTTLDPTAQQVAYDALGGRRGAVVAIAPRTGAVKVMAANPTYDPARGPRGGDQFNRATQSFYAPGSTFKVVTAAAALDSGRFTPDSVVDGSSPKVISGVPLANSGGASFGPISLTTALTNSVNTVWAQVAETLGTGTLERYMRRFGFYAKPPLDYPADQMRASGELRRGRLVPPVDVGRTAIGQGGLAVTPLQMAMVAAAVANRGVLMRPHFTDRITDPEGREVQRVEPRDQARVMKPESAEQLAQMMANVVSEGTGTAAALSGIDVAGKTGTAEVPCGPQQVITNQTWFIAFAPVERPRIAVAVTVECSGGQGGTVAAPIAKQVMQTLLGDDG